MDISGIYRNMDYKKIQNYREKIKRNRQKLTEEKDEKRKKRLTYIIGIDEFKIELEKLKD